MFLLGLIAQIILGLFFTPEGVIKWTHIGPSTARFEHFRYPRWFRYLTGLCEFLAGIGLLIGLWFPLLAVLAALLLCIVMIGALYSHTFRGKDPLPDLLPATVFLVLACIVLVAHGEYIAMLLGASK